MRNRAYRRHQRARTLARHLRDHRFLHGPNVPSAADVASRHPADCGRHCLLCHGTKFLEPRRARERRAWTRQEDA